MLKRSIGYALIVTIVTASIAALAAEPDMQVLESNVPEIRIGTRVSNETVSALPTGARVRVLLPTLKTKVFEGPTAGPTRSWGGTRGPRD
jgi:hypothetical protein